LRGHLEVKKDISNYLEKDETKDAALEVILLIDDIYNELGASNINN